MHNKIILIIGPKGSGKTETANELMRKLERVAVYDLVRDSKYVKDTVVIIGKPQEFAQAIGKDKEKFKVIYQPAIVEVMENGLVDSPEFANILKLCHLRGNMYLIIDEAHLICNSRNCPSELMLANLIGRHQEFSMILIAQSFTGIHPAIRKNADEFYFYKIIEPSDLNGIEERCGKEVSEQVRNLRALEVDDKEKFKRAGQRVHWSKFGGVIEVTE